MATCLTWMCLRRRSRIVVQVEEGGRCSFVGRVVERVVVDQATGTAVAVGENDSLDGDVFSGSAIGEKRRRQYEVNIA